MYKCLECGREVEVDLGSTKKIICPFCGYRIVRKDRPTVVKRVHAR